MAAKKAPSTKAAPVAAILKFKKEWIFDPPPEFLRVNKATLARINQLKNEFVANVNEAIKAGQL